MYAERILAVCHVSDQHIVDRGSGFGSVRRIPPEATVDGIIVAPNNGWEHYAMERHLSFFFSGGLGDGEGTE